MKLPAAPDKSSPIVMGPSVRSLTLLLVVLFTVQPLLTGCSMIGYGIGYSVDEDLAVRTPVDSIDELEFDEPLVLTFTDGRELEGWKREPLGESRLIVSHYVMRNGTWVKADTTVALEDIAGVERREFSTVGRLFFAPIGVVIDLVIVITILWFTPLWGPE